MRMGAVISSSVAGGQRMGLCNTPATSLSPKARGVGSK